MSIVSRLADYLELHEIHYQTIEHSPTLSSIGTAITSQIPPHQIAKAVLLKNHDERNLLAILPAQNKVSLSTINLELDGQYRLVKEQELYRVFGGGGGWILSSTS